MTVTATEDGFDPFALRAMRLAGQMCAAAALLIGLVVMLGWITGVELLKSFLPAQAAGKCNSALAVAGAGAALLLRDRGGRLGSWVARALLAAAGLLGGLTAAEWITGRDLGIDQWLFAEAAGTVATEYPGRMALVAAVELVLLAAAGLSCGRRRPWRGQWLATAGLCMATTVLLGYSFGDHDLYAVGSVTHIAFPIGLALALLFVATLVGQAESSWVGKMASGYAGGAMLRRAVPFAVLAPWGIGWIVLEGSRSGLYSYNLDQVVNAGPLIALSLAFLFRCAKALDVLDMKEREAAEQIREINRDLERRIEQRTEQLLVANEASRLSERRYRSLVEATSQVVWTTNASGEVTADLPSWQSFTGLSHGQIQGWGWVDSLHPEDQTATAAAWQAAVAGRSLYSTEYRLRRRDGEYRYMSVRGVPVVDEEGGIREWVGTCTDITERKSAELAEQRERKRFLDVLDRLPAYVILLTQDYHVAFSNRVFRERFGESGGRRCFEFLFHRDTPCEICETYKVLPTKKPVGWEWVGPDGRNYDISDFPFTDQDGSTLILEMGIDVTERVRATKELQEKAALLQLTPAAIFVRDMQRRITFWSRGAEELYGWKAEEVAGKVVHELLGTEFPEPTAAIEARVGAGEVWQGELHHTCRDGRRIAVGSRWALQRDHAGEPAGYLEVNVDITERRHAERELTRLNRALVALNRCMEVVARAGDEGTLLQQVCDLVVNIGGYPLSWIGYAENDPVKSVRPVAIAGFGAEYVRNARITWGNDERGHGPTGTAIRSGEPCYIPDTALDPRFTPWRDSASRHGYASVMAVPLKQGERVFGSINLYAPERNAFDEEERALMVELASMLSHGIVALRTRAERDRATAELLEVNESLERRVAERTAALAASTEEMESFTYSVSHDLRAPLRHIDGFSKVLLEQYGEMLDETGRHYLERVRQGTQTMGLLVDDLLNLSRIGRQAMRLESVDLNGMVRQVIEEVKSEIEGRAIEWRIAPLPALPCDLGLMHQVWFNLLSNAVKFTRGRTPAVIEVGMEGAELFVRDNGVGFDPVYADKLFGVFQRLHRVEEFEGTGVGLATVRRILQKHGGDIRAEAEPDKGATFYFTVNRAVAPAKPTEVLHAA